MRQSFFIWMWGLVLVCLCISAEGEGHDVLLLKPQDGKPGDSTNNLISVDFTNAPLFEVLDYFAKAGPVNVVAGSVDLDMRVSVHLERAPWQPALESLLNACDLLLTQSDFAVPSDIFMIVGMDRPKPPPKSPYGPFSIVIEAAVGTFYEVYMMVYHDSSFELVASGRIGADGTTVHQLSAGEHRVRIQVRAVGHETWEVDLRLLPGEKDQQTITAVLKQKSETPGKKSALQQAILFPPNAKERQRSEMKAERMGERREH